MQTKQVATFDISGTGPHYLYPGGYANDGDIWPSSGIICSISVSDATGTANHAVAVYDMAQVTDGAMLGGAAGALTKGVMFLTPGGTLTAETQNPADIRGTADPGIASFRKIWEGNVSAGGEQEVMCATCPAGIILVTPQLAAGHLRVVWSPLVRGAARRKAVATTYEHMPSL